MPRLTRKIIAVLLASALVVLAAMLWRVLSPHTATVILSQPRACEEWEKAEVINQGLGWNFTYESLLSRSGLCPGEAFCEIVAERPKPPLDKYVAALQGDPIISALLYELPDGHAGLGATLVIRTKDHAYAWVFHAEQSIKVDKQPVPVSDYDRVFEEMACWRQDEPPNRAFGEKGYIGFLSLCESGVESEQ